MTRILDLPYAAFTIGVEVQLAMTQSRQTLTLSTRLSLC